MGEEAPARPRTPVEMFLAFQHMALQGFGGVMPVAQRELVERRGWLTAGEFVELLSLAQVLPGANVVNLALIYGDRQFGLRGAAAALGGLLLLPLAGVLALAMAVRHWNDMPGVAGALRGMGAVAAGLVLATALRLAPSLRRNALGLPAACSAVCATFVAVGLLRLPLPAVVVFLGGFAVALAWRRLGL